MMRTIVGGCTLAALTLAAWAQPPDAESSPEPGVPEDATQVQRLDPIVVTAATMQDPYTIVTDPRQPRLPLPAHDGGAYLKSIPGFSLSRKGGTSGDPALRGLGGSRLTILLDDTQAFGGCGMRMDPPTAYVAPESYDRIVVIKGPQSVRYGPTLAGFARFERDPARFTESTISGFGSTTAGSFARRDFTGDLTVGERYGYARMIGTVSSQDDYRDGRDRRVHSEYQRWSATSVLGWTPDDHTLVELSAERSDARAAYDDRGMDGVLFDRTGYTLRVARAGITPWLDRLEALWFYSYVDHVMDNYTLRSPPMMPMVSYPDRRTTGGRLSAEFHPASIGEIIAGVDWSDDRHRANSISGMAAFGYREVPRLENAEFGDTGAFVELERQIRGGSRLNAGLRIDRRESTALAAAGFGGALPGTEERSRQQSGFLRLSHDFPARPLTVYAGLGRAERAPDFWELRRVFDLSTETLTQVDLGAGLRTARARANLALFAGRIDDFILIARPGVGPTQARNVDAETWGLEADLEWKLGRGFSTTVTAAYVRSRNQTDDVPLAQTPPLEATLSLDHEAERHFAGLLLRAVARQDRIHPGHGTIYSFDTDETPGFAVLSAYAGWRFGPRLVATTGIDNLMDRSYGEHVQLGNAELGSTGRRILEPGRTLWARLSAEF